MAVHRKARNSYLFHGIQSLYEFPQLSLHCFPVHSPSPGADKWNFIRKKSSPFLISICRFYSQSLQSNQPNPEFYARGLGIFCDLYLSILHVLVERKKKMVIYPSIYLPVEIKKTRILRQTIWNYGRKESFSSFMTKGSCITKFPV